MWLVVTVVKLIMARSSLVQASETKRPAEETSRATGTMDGDLDDEVP